MASIYYLAASFCVFCCFVVGDMGKANYPSIYHSYRYDNYN